MKGAAAAQPWLKTVAALALVTLFSAARADAEASGPDTAYRLAQAGGTAAAPSAGGYNSEFGSDYGVGRVQRAAGRQPVLALGFKGKTPGGAIPWVGLRFAEMLTERMQPLMGRSAPDGALSRFLASRGTRAHDVALPAAGADLLALPALAQMRAGSNWKTRSDIVLIGDVLVRGVAANANPVAQADALMRDGATVTVRVRALRNQPRAAAVASRLIEIRAPGREWAQLPARVALALLDDMRITLTEDERTDLLRDASPLLTPASQLRVRTEARYGAAAARALDAHVLNFKAQRAATPAAATQHSRRALAAAEAAVRELRGLVQRPAAATIRDGDIFAGINASARNWLPYAEAAMTAARRKLKGR